MNDAPEYRDTSNTSSTLIGFAVGAVVGAGLALLLAPHSGKKTRQRLASTARRWSRDAGHTLDDARGTVAELSSDAQAAVKAGKDAFLRDLASREARAERRLSQAAGSGPSPNSVERTVEEGVR